MPAFVRIADHMAVDSCGVKQNTLGLLRSLASVYLRLGPRIFRHLNFNCRVAWPYRERVGVEGVRSEAAHAVTTDPSAIGNKHELSTSPPMPVALGRNEAHQEFVSRLECLLRPAIREHVSRTCCFHAPGLLFALIILQGEMNLDMRIGPYVLRHRRFRRDAMIMVKDPCRSMMREYRGTNREKAQYRYKEGNHKLTCHVTSP